MPKNGKIFFAKNKIKKLSIFLSYIMANCESPDKNSQTKISREILDRVMSVTILCNVSHVLNRS